jgi:gas vesicle protein
MLSEVKMSQRNPEGGHGSDVNHPGSFLAGLLLGALAGAGTMLLLAPQSGKRTRDQIQQRSMELRDQTAETVEDAVDQVRATAHQVTVGVGEKADQLQQRGQEMLDEGMERVSAVVEAGKTAAHAS